MGFLPELKVDGVKMAQLTPMLVYLSKVSLTIPKSGLSEALEHKIDGAEAPKSRHLLGNLQLIGCFRLVKWTGLIQWKNSNLV